MIDSDTDDTLDRKIDCDNGGVSRHLGRIADFMSEWEGRIAEELDLKSSDVSAIRTRYPGDLKLQA